MRGIARTTEQGRYCIDILKLNWPLLRPDTWECSRIRSLPRTSRWSFVIEATLPLLVGDCRRRLAESCSPTRTAAALREMHGDVERAWTTAELARAAGQSRSCFFDRFARLVGVRPMEHLLAARHDARAAEEVLPPFTTTMESLILAPRAGD